MSTIDYAKARELMVEQQVRPWEVLDERVLEVISAMPREQFVAEAHRALAYADLALPLGHGQRMMKPVVEGRALQSILAKPFEEVLEVGTGSGYLAACLGRLARDVVSLELYPELADAARERLAEQRITNVEVVQADAMAWTTSRRFDAICVSGAVLEVPERFMEWLKPGGRLFAVRGRSPAMEAVLVHHDVNGPRTESLFETDLPYLVGAAPVPAFEL
ncbi:protein-L-isoaspartate O-methyltransferase family protein [Novilysobacter spongiicola]|uniref:Protein-L-isoaspartate O-methyltransferase n=1 Tax=Lysobacter spongiicola DSM 21749 TaxID=1122188 RepID=A0A1T4QH03_9GAMM|nr:protein-L-isoaspartate O-methyltransferase [Lysobacter spongiicola]SKA03005.1 protein-L-isoaspartate(D-aspartate) O-methyltransferase [Lysobacter spongiicola DSM 21749]